MEWFEVALTVSEVLRDSVTNRLFELGAQGVSEDDTKGQAPFTIRGFFEETVRSQVDQDLPPYLASLSEIFPNEPTVNWKITQVIQENWGDRYKEHYHSQRLSRLFFLKPEWEMDAEVPEEMIPIIMEPKQAFGTGLHSSTKLCLSLLETVMRFYPVQSKIRVIDVGTGSGILAIGAYLLGFRDIVAIDTDPISVETAAENFELNKVVGVNTSATPIEELKGPYELIIANILLETHLMLRHEYRRVIAPGGQLMLSGLLGNQLPMVREAMAEVGFIEEFSDHLQEWAAIVFTAKRMD